MALPACERVECTARRFRGQARRGHGAGRCGAGVRPLVARCEVTYTGRSTAVLPEATRLLLLESDGSVLVHSDVGGHKPENWNC